MHLREMDAKEGRDPSKIQTALEALFMNLVKVFPGYTALKFTPHLTLGQWPGLKEAQHDLTLFSKSKTFNSMRWLLSHYVYILRYQYIEFEDTRRQLLYPDSVTMYPVWEEFYIV